MKHCKAQIIPNFSREKLPTVRELMSSQNQNCDRTFATSKKIKHVKKIKTMSKLTVPTREEVSNANQAIFDNLKEKIGFVPNMYAYIAKSETALGDLLGFSGRTSTLKAKEQEVINLVTSQINNCSYCLSAHTTMGKMNGFTDNEILELRTGTAGFDAQLNALAQFTHEAVSNNGNVSDNTKEAFFSAGYNEANLVDVTFAIGVKTISNFIHNLAEFDVDFPVAPQLEAAQA